MIEEQATARRNAERKMKQIEGEEEEVTLSRPMTSETNLIEEEVRSDRYQITQTGEDSETAQNKTACGYTDTSYGVDRDTRTEVMGWFVLKNEEDDDVKKEETNLLIPLPPKASLPLTNQQRRKEGPQTDHGRAPEGGKTYPQ